MRWDDHWGRWSSREIKEEIQQLYSIAGGLGLGLAFNHISVIHWLTEWPLRSSRLKSSPKGRCFPWVDQTNKPNKQRPAHTVLSYMAPCPSPGWKSNHRVITCLTDHFEFVLWVSKKHSSNSLSIEFHQFTPSLSPSSLYCDWRSLMK